LPTVTGAGLIVSGFSSCASADEEIKFAGPVDGDMLTEYDGIVRNGSLFTIVRLTAPAGMDLRDNSYKPSFFSDYIFD
jgi:hypothetical protein